MTHTLQSLNDSFCSGAESLRYINQRIGEKGAPYQFFSNTVVPSSPEEGSWLRSVKFDNMNSYLFVLDVDGKGIDRELLKGVYGLYDTTYNYLHVKPILKASGSKGAQLIFRLNFPNNIDASQCAEHMRNLAYTIWKLSTYQTRKRVLFDDVPGIDCAMFKRNQMVRSFCKHLGSGNFSVPFKYGEGTWIVRRRMRLEKPPLEFDGFPELDFDESKILHTYEKKQFLPKVSLEKTLKISRASSQSERDEIYKALPNVIKRLVSADHIEHELKWPVIVYLHLFERLNEKEIVDWLFEQSNWDDLTKTDLTNYHVNWSCNWARDCVSKDNPKIPMPKYILSEITDELFGFKIAQTDSEKTTLSQYCRGIRQRFLHSLKSEPSSTQQI